MNSPSSHSIPRRQPVPYCKPHNKGEAWNSLRKPNAFAPKHIAPFLSELLPSLGRWKIRFIFSIWVFPQHNILSLKEVRDRSTENSLIEIMEETTSLSSYIPSFLRDCITHPSSTSHTKMISACCSSYIDKFPLLQPVIKPKERCLTIIYLISDELVDMRPKKNTLNIYLKIYNKINNK